jgi:hypothetical protein
VLITLTFVVPRVIVCTRTVFEFCCRLVGTDDLRFIEGRLLSTILSRRGRGLVVVSFSLVRGLNVTDILDVAIFSIYPFFHRQRCQA